VRQAVVGRYLERSRQAFVTAYRQATANLAHGWRASAADAALVLFSLEKAAYELAYEAQNRPAWLHVPLRGLAGLLRELPDFSDIDGEQS
ncbi:hypothetical protein, partial [Pseudomonas piscis]